MSWMDVFKSYRKGSDIRPGETIRHVTPARMSAQPPHQYETADLHSLVHTPPFSELVILTDRHLVYKTNYALLDLLKSGFVAGAQRYAPPVATDMIQWFTDRVDTTDQDLWVPWGEIAAIAPGEQQARLSQLFGTSEIAFYYFEVQSLGGRFWLLECEHDFKRAGMNYLQTIDALRALNRL